MQVTLQPHATQKKILKLVAKGKTKQNKKGTAAWKKLLCQSRYFHNAFLNQKSLWKGDSKWLQQPQNQSISWRYNMRVLTPSFIAAKHRPLWNAWSSNTPEPPSCVAQIITARALNISISSVVLLVPGAAKQGERAVRPHVSIKARLSLTSPFTPSTSGDSFQMRSITYHCLHLGKMGSLLARLTCYIKLPHLKPHTHTSKDISQWLGL